MYQYSYHFKTKKGGLLEIVKSVVKLDKVSIYKHIKRIENEYNQENVTWEEK